MWRSQPPWCWARRSASAADFLNAVRRDRHTSCCVYDAAGPLPEGNSALAATAATAAPNNCAAMKAGTWLMAMPANVVVNPRASVTAGLANEVEDVNQ